MHDDSNAEKTQSVGPEEWPPAGRHVGRAHWVCRQLGGADPAHGPANTFGCHFAPRYDLGGFGYHRLGILIEVITRDRLGLRNTEPDILGRAYEYLLRKFAEGQGQSAGEFYTPKEVGRLLAELYEHVWQCCEAILFGRLQCGSACAKDTYAGTGVKQLGRGKSSWDMQLEFVVYPQKEDKASFAMER
jgi:hypothetical protein